MRHQPPDSRSGRKTYHIPKPLAKLDCRLQNLLPGTDPFIKPWMIDLSDDHSPFDISRPRTLLGWEPRHSLPKSLPTIRNKLKFDPVSWYQTNNLCCASTGTDAIRGYRIFNPLMQSKKFDAKGEYIRRYVTKLAKVPLAAIHEPRMTLEDQIPLGCPIGLDYPAPIIDHHHARQEYFDLGDAVKMDRS